MKTRIDLTITNFGTFWKAKMNGQELSKESFYKLMGLHPRHNLRTLQGFENENYKVELWERDCT